MAQRPPSDATGSALALQPCPGGGWGGGDQLCHTGGASSPSVRVPALQERLGHIEPGLASAF